MLINTLFGGIEIASRKKTEQFLPPHMGYTFAVSLWHVTIWHRVGKLRLCPALRTWHQSSILYRDLSKLRRCGFSVMLLFPLQQVQAKQRQACYGLGTIRMAEGASIMSSL